MLCKTWQGGMCLLRWCEDLQVLPFINKLLWAYRQELPEVTEDRPA